MDELLHKVGDFIRRQSLFEGGRGVVVAVSGGPDSVTLLDLLARLREAGPPVVAPDWRLHVAHLNHRLRGREADEDAEFVGRLAERYGLPATIAAADVRAAAEAAKGNLEETARRIRYRFLFDVARRNGLRHVATGHTMNDQAETLLMRLVRGAGPRGLMAMRPLTAWEDAGFLARPLLCVTREEVEGYCRKRGLAYRTDASNLTPELARNRVRREVLPGLRELNPRAVEAIARAADLLADEQAALDEAIDGLLSEARQDGGGGAEAIYSAAALGRLPDALRRRLLFEMLRRARKAERDRMASRPAAAAQVSAVERLLDEPAGGRIELPGLEVWRDGEALVIRAAARAPDDRELGGDAPQVEAGGWRITLERGLAGGSFFEEARRWNGLAGRDWMAAVLDDARLPERLVVRTRRPGERAEVRPGRRATKLKKLMIDHKIPASQRASWPVVATLDGGYVWSPGLPPSINFAANDETRRLAILRASSSATAARERRPARLGEQFMGKELRIVRTEEEIRRRITELAGELREEARTDSLTVAAVLDDAFVFLADLIRALDMRISLCLMKVAHNRHGGQTEVMYTSEFDPSGRDILLVSGVCATGVTLDYVSRYLAGVGARSLRTCVLVDKPAARRVDMRPDFVAFQIDEGYVLGYGLGLEDQFRHLPYLAVLDESPEAGADRNGARGGVRL